MPTPNCIASWHVFDTSRSAPPLTESTRCQCGSITFADAPAPLRAALAPRQTTGDEHG